MRQLSRPVLAATIAAALAVIAIVVSFQEGPSAEAAGSADVKVVSLTFGTPNGTNQCVNPAPTEIPVNTNVTVCTRLTFHNNGPTSPVDVSIDRSAQFVPQGGQPSNECTISPTSGLLTFTNVSSSVTLTRDENYTVNCTNPSFHKFRVTNTLSVGPAGNTDPDTSNNSATTDLDVGVTAEADFSIVSQILYDADCTSPAPTTILVNTDAVFCLVKTVHNAGPFGPTAADIFFRSDAPADCTLVPFVDSNGAQLQVSVNFTLSELFTLNCSQPSSHTFMVENFLEPVDVHVTDPDGVSYMATQHTVAVLGQADVKIQSQNISAPLSAQPGQPFTVTVNKTVHNNGPVGPVTVSIAASVSAPPDCSVTPDPGNPTSANLPVSAATPLTENFEVTCTDPSNHQITIENCIAFSVLHLTDPNTANNCSQSSVNVPISVDADLKIQSQSVNAPSQADAGVAFDITIQKTVHNNGPAPSAPATITSNVSGPADCTITPDPGNPAAVTLSPSVATNLSESFSVVCTGPSFHEFTVENCIDPSNVHVVDNIPGNNCQIDSVTVAIVGESDVKITFQEVIDPPPAPINTVAIDMDPNNTPANTATSYGTVENCGEVTTGNTTIIDVIVDEVPPYNGTNGGIVGVEFTLNYDPTKVHVVAKDYFFLLAANGITPIDFSDDTSDPFPDDDGTYTLAVVDFGAGAPESGVGVLGRVTLQGVGSGTSPLTLSGIALTDGGFEPYSITNTVNAEVRVDGACPLPPTPTPSPTPSPSPSPTPSPGVPPDLIFDVGEDFGIKLIKTMHNNGPAGPTNVSINTSFSAPPDCELLDMLTNPTSATLPVSSSVQVTENFLASCDSPSEHTFSFTNCIEVTDEHVTDPNPGNNCWTSNLVVVILSQTDLKITSQTLDAPPEAETGTPFGLTLTKTVHNNGPSTPGNANIVTNVSAPPDCTVTPDPGNPASVTLDASVSQHVTEVFSVTCDEPSFHDFQIENCLQVADIHQSDPDTENNCETSQATVSATAEADLKITAQQFYAADCTSPAPDMLPPNTDLTLCASTTLHNNGPFGPMDANVQYVVTPPPGCTSNPDNVTVPANNMQVSTAQVQNQSFTLNCTTGGMHNFQFTTTLAPQNIHIDDPQANNNIETEVVELRGDEADPKITAVVVDCPDDAMTNTTFDCDVHVTVHNNGPTTPVPVDVETELVGAFDCTLTPPGSQTESRLLVASTSQVITYKWSVTCTEYSFHQFMANSELEMSDPGILELDPNNNTGTGQDTTTVSAPVDVKVTAVTGTAPANSPANTPFNVQVDVSVHNNGPASPIKVEGGAGIAVPSDCTVAPGPYQLFNIMVVPASATQVVTKDFTVSCSQNGDHQIVVCGRAGPNTLHVQEQSQHSNFKNTAIIVNIGGNSPTFVPTTSCSILGDPPEVCGNGIDDDGDTEIDEEPDTDLDGLSDCVDLDDDNDGYPDVLEEYIGTDPLNPCARAPFDSAWPPDFDNNQRINTTDVLALKPIFGTKAGDANFGQRGDLDGNGKINTTDVLSLKPVFGITCTN
ncbi:MAG TPA: dockerin type I domain-containing protein [Dehalococcoidia bacterium]|nr:dockerin type I domain-containing protein [Dehalococcoidia bacterium]